MKSSSTKLAWDDNNSGVIDVEVVSEGEDHRVVPMPQERHSEPNPAGALTTTGGSFTTFLAPLNQETFKEVVTGVEDKLRVVNQTLSWLTDSQGFESILQEMLSAITLKTGELLGADRTTIYLLDEEKNELWSIVAKDQMGGTLEIRFPATQGIAGEVATFKKVVNIPYDFYDDPRSSFAKITDQKNNYRTSTMLVLPLLNEQGDLVSVVQLLNKLKFPNDPDKPLAERIDLGGFSSEDERVFEEFAPSIRLILESSKSFYAATQKQRAAEALMKATQSLSQSNLDLEDTLTRVMDEAKKLMNADRSTLWLLDSDRNQLWTKIPIAGKLQEIRIPRTAGFAGLVAESGEPLMIPFDIYDDSRSETSKQTDQRTGYRTCSMLCMPVFNADGELIGVTQLINKKKQGEFPAYDPAEWPKAPDCWKSSFNRTDQDFMEIFNIQAGVALQNAKLFATVKQQEQMQRDILRCLSNGVISTDKDGKVIAANESAKRLLGMGEDEFLEGKSVLDLVMIKAKDEKEDNKFIQWFQAALGATEEKNRQQYYPDQLLQSLKEEQHSVNLSINTIVDAGDSTKTNGALVVMEDISDEKRLKTTMYRYMNQDLAEQLINSGGEARLGGDLKEVSILFSDIRGYTTLTEKMEPEDVVKMLNEYFEDMVEALFKYKGTLDKYIGDAMMAVFGSPLPLDDHEWMAVQTAVEMRHRLAQFNVKRVKDNKDTISIGIGINSDKVLSGNIGSSKRMEFTAIGDGVNLGSRLEGASKQYGCDIVISENTFRPCKERIWYRELDCIRVKGKNEPIKLYELVGLLAEPISDAKKQSIDFYHRGREFYLNRKFTRAMGEFGAILEEIDSHDKAAILHLKRCQHFLQEPPPDDWDGVWTLTEK
jgi:PAS domain S-box-containing protein